jgi:hypothetical protein
MPALPLDQAGPYVAGAYVAFVALILVYVAIMSWRLSRIERELRDLDELAARGGDKTREAAAPAREEVSV